MDLNVVVPTFPESFAFVALRKGHLSGAEQFLDDSMFNDRRLTEICLLLLELRLRAKLEVTRLRPDENDTRAGQDGVATCLPMRPKPLMAGSRDADRASFTPSMMKRLLTPPLFPRTFFADAVVLHHVGHVLRVETDMNGSAPPRGPSWRRAPFAFQRDRTY